MINIKLIYSRAFESIEYLCVKPFAFSIFIECSSYAAYRSDVNNNHSCFFFSEPGRLKSIFDLQVKPNIRQALTNCEEICLRLSSILKFKQVSRTITDLARKFYILKLTMKSTESIFFQRVYQGIIATTKYHQQTTRPYKHTHHT